VIPGPGRGTRLASDGEEAEPIDAVLIDLDGVLVTGGRPLPGAVETIGALREREIPFRCVTNTTRSARATIAERLASLGFDIPADWIFTPSAAAIRRIRECGSDACTLIATGDVHRDFTTGRVRLVEGEAPFVVVGDAGECWTYERLTHAFRLLLDGSRLLALERDRFWRDADGLVLSAGPFVVALEFAAGVRAEVMGKPSPSFFGMALADLGVSSDRAAMIGDDIATDIGGAQGAGLRGWLVHTGKYRPGAPRGTVTPDRELESIADLPALLE
jgi:HAD superfamily hydrolase (TIGR01458 family)